MVETFRRSKSRRRVTIAAMAGAEVTALSVVVEPVVGVAVVAVVVFSVGEVAGFPEV